MAATPARPRRWRQVSSDVLLGRLFALTEQQDQHQRKEESAEDDEVGGLEVREATIGEKGFVEDEEGTEKAETSDERRQNSRLRARGKRLRVQRGAPEEP